MADVLQQEYYELRERQHTTAVVFIVCVLWLSSLLLFRPISRGVFIRRASVQPMATITRPSPPPGIL